MANRLADATSPYLLQHKDNPVEWWPWGPEAFAQARRRDVPLLLSVGYAACHWCHVMAHESFEDGPTAALMNEHFVCVKVDREERPDVDAVYMEATQVMTGQGGWPMTVLATPDGEPFLCGTYFRRAHFQQLLRRVAEAWQQQRDAVIAQGQQVVAALGGAAELPSAPLTAAVLDAAAQTLQASYDAARGGFGGAPKFPPSMCLEFLLRHAARTGSADALAMVAGTAEAMARGGIYDQLGGGFARYSVDAGWVVPHFEKMLYDNALLLRVYVHWWRQGGGALARRIALETADWVLRDLRTPEGGLASALDADSEGEEGRYYVWTPAQLREVLGPTAGDYAAQLFTVTPQGSFEHGASVLQLRSDPDDEQRAADVRRRLLAARDDRVRPARDDKVVAAWNGLAIAGIAEAGALFGRPELVAAAVEVAKLLVDVHLVDGRLRRTSRAARVGANAGVLEDYGDVAEGLIALYSVTGEPRWLTCAGELLEVVLRHFAAADGGFFDTADDAEALVRRPRDRTDNAVPSGQSAAAGALLSYGALTGSTRHRDAADAALATTARLAVPHARFVGWALAVGEAALAGPAEVAIVGDPSDAGTAALVEVARRSPAPGAVVAVGIAGSAAAQAVPLLAGRPQLGGRPTAYVCRGFSCRAPIVDPIALSEQLADPDG